MKRVFTMLLIAAPLAASPLALANPSAPANAATPALSPVQLAFLKAETKKANDLFVQRVAKIARASEAQVARALPDEKRITDRIARLISALEKDLKRTLSDDDKAAIAAAEEERKESLIAAREAAKKK